MRIPEGEAMDLQQKLRDGQPAVMILRGFTSCSKKREVAECFVQSYGGNCCLRVEVPHVSYADAFVGKLYVGAGVEMRRFSAAAFEREDEVLLLDGTCARVGHPVQ
jgi:hypothetical protein